MADTSTRRRSALVLTLVLSLGLVGCGGDDDGDADVSATTDTTTTSTTEAAGEPADTEPESDPAEVEAFCAELERLDVATSEDYVGSEQHLADVEGLLAVSPDEIRPVVERFRDFVGSGQITDDPGSKDLESWPADVQADVAAIRDFEASTC